jgi:hypothetical protein
VAALSSILSDPERPHPVREQAALSLGALPGPNALERAAAAFGRVDDEALSDALLEGLGTRSFAETESFFRAVLEDAALPPARRAAALDALGNSTDDAASLLVWYAAQAPTAEERLAAASALALLDQPGEALAALRGLLEHEPEPDVRVALYQALASDPDGVAAAGGAARLLTAVLSERVDLARAEGARLLGTGLAADPDPALAARFDAELVPWLDEQARESSLAAVRSASVEALAAAATPDSVRALEALAGVPDPRVAGAAGRALARRAAAP